MKHAILITAYKDFQQLANLVKEFPAADYNLYIHIDKKSKVNEKVISKISAVPNVKYISRKYTINWGGLNHLNAFLHLSEIALKDIENVYFHSITAQDFPLKNTDYFNEFLLSQTDDAKGYMEFFTLPKPSWKNGGIDRLEYYHLYTHFNVLSKRGKKIISLVLKIQKKLNFKRPINFKEKLYGGSTYWTLPRNILQFLIDYTKRKPAIYQRLKNTQIAEEIYVQTVLMNSEHAKNMVNDNLRFMDWANGDGLGPAFLNINNYEEIMKSNKLFARKIAANEVELLKKLKSQKDQTE